MCLIQLSLHSSDSRSRVVVQLLYLCTAQGTVRTGSCCLRLFEHIETRDCCYYYCRLTIITCSSSNSSSFQIDSIGECEIRIIDL